MKVIQVYLMNPSVAWLYISYYEGVTWEAYVYPVSLSQEKYKIEGYSRRHVCFQLARITNE